MAPFHSKPLGMMLEGVQSFIHLTIVFLELGGSWGPVMLPMSSLPEAVRPQWGKPEPVRELF